MSTAQGQFPSSAGSAVAFAREEEAKLPDFIKIEPSEDASKGLEALFSEFARGLVKWVECERQKTIDATISRLASLGYLTMATPSSPVPKSIVLPGLVPIDVPIPPDVEVVNPKPPDPETSEPEDETIEFEASPSDELNPVDNKNSDVWAEPLTPADVNSASFGAVSSDSSEKPHPSAVTLAKTPKRGRKKELTPEELELKERRYRIRKAFQQKNLMLRKKGLPPIPQPSSWDTLMNQKDNEPVDAAPCSVEDG